MGKPSKWLRNFWGSNKKKQDKENEEKEKLKQTLSSAEDTFVATANQNPKEKRRRWSFCRSHNKYSSSSNSFAANADTTTTGAAISICESESEQKKHEIFVTAATTKAADAATLPTHAIAVVSELTTMSNKSTASEEIAIIKIQAAFRSHLARKALRALKGLVKLQALVRGHLVRKQAAATLRCVQALVTAQARARAQRIRMVEDSQPHILQLSADDRTHQEQLRHSYHADRRIDENIKIVEMDTGESRDTSKFKRSNSSVYSQKSKQTISTHVRSLPPLPKPDCTEPPAPTPLTDVRQWACTENLEEYSFMTTQSVPQYLSAKTMPDTTEGPFGASSSKQSQAISNDSFFPSYMANTESSRAKARSQSAPKQRPESFERVLARRRASMDSRSVPRGVRIQRSSSQVGSSKGHQYAGTIKLDRSAVSLKDSECDSTCSVLTSTNYRRSLVAIDVHEKRN